MRDIVERLRGTTRSMAFLCSVDMGLWDDHSNVCLEAAAEIERLRTLNTEMVEVLTSLLVCPAIADGGHDDPEWGCQESAVAAAKARATLAKAGGGN